LSQPKLQQELEAEVASLDEDYGDMDLEKLPLLNAVIEETLRLYGAAPAGLPRSVPPGGVTIDDQVIPAGTTVTTQAYTFHRDQNLFPRPLE
jgi:cytochrome P450